MNQWLSGVSPAPVLDVAVRVTLLIALTYAVTSCLRRSAALRHAVWMAALMLLHVVPWLPRAVPEITVASIPALIGAGDRDTARDRALPLGLTTECDDAAVHRGLSMYEYAQHLVAVARV